MTARTVRRACILGGESTGKTTLAMAAAAALDEPWVAEYGRELWLERRGQLIFEDLLHIAEEQVRREEVFAAQAREVLICDTSPLTTLFYSIAGYGRADPKLVALSHRPYDVTVLCEDDFPFVQDGARAGVEFRDRGQAWYRRVLEERGVACTVLRGSPAQRLQALLALVSGR